jgi:histidyl-tRNA synthetase
MKIETPKGVRDILPEEKILKDEVVKTLIKTFEEFGFFPLETPILEKYELLSSKYAGGAEILKETYKLKDQGNRKLGLRYDLTVPLARFVAMNPNLKMPFKRYQIDRVFRDGPIKLGRYREFWQCDADIVGSKGILADAECIEIQKIGFKKLNIPVNILVNNRKILDSLMKKANIPKKEAGTAILSVDKLAKIGKSGVVKELKEKGFTKKQSETVLELCGFEGTNKQKVDYLKKIIPSCEGVKEMEELLKLVKGVTFDLRLARGLSYYTGIVMETFAKQSKISSSLGSGGRYDEMVGNFLGREMPAIGCSFGLEPIMDYLKEKNIKSKKTKVKVLIIPIKTEKESFELAKKLREEGINTDLDLNGKNITKNLNYANTYEIPYCIFLGSKELKKEKYTLRDMNTGEENTLNFKKLLKKINSS